MAKDFDANPLYSKEESPFTTALLDFYEAQQETRGKDLSIKNEISSGMRIEGRDAENIQRTLEGASKYGATHVAFQLSGADRSLQGDSIVFFQNDKDARYYAKGQELAAGEKLILAPVDNLHAELKKQLESHKENKQDGQALPDITIKLENVYERHVPDREVTPERISMEPTSLRELIEKTQHAAIVKEEVPGYGKTSILEGRINKEEIPAIQQALQVEKDSGNRFVTFPIKEELQASDFKAHRSALAALDHQYEQSKGTEKQEVRSLAVVEKDLDKLLENKKEQGLDIKMENQREDKRSRGMDLER